MKKIIITILLSLSLIGCSQQSFKSYQEADEILLKGVYNEDIDWDGFQKDYLTKENGVTEEEFNKMKKISAVHLEDGSTEILEEDNSTMIYDKSSNSEYPDVVISWKYEDKTYKVDDIIVAKTY